MPKTIQYTTDDFILLSKQKYGENKFDYSMVNVTKWKEPVSLKCNDCGNSYMQLPIYHLGDKCKGCKYCSPKKEYVVESRRLTTEQFVEKAIAVHGDKYDYSKTVYVLSDQKVIIHCKTCSEDFQQTPNGHLDGRGCTACGINKRSVAQRKKQIIFLADIERVHPGKFDTSQVNYINDKTKVDLKCLQCGNEFSALPNNLLSGNGCTPCSIVRRGESRTKTTEQFVKKANEIHNERYDYSETVYVKAKVKCTIICNMCRRKFEQNPDAHLQGRGCPFCRESSGERTIERVLKGMGIEYERQKKFEDCKNVMPLPFDFFVAGKGCIEFNGEQHYRVVPYWGGEAKFEMIQLRDAIKHNYCVLKNIPFLVIPYTEKDVEGAVTRFVESLKQ